VLSVRFDWSEIVLNGTEIMSCDELSDKKIVAFAGIGNPYAFFTQAREHGLMLRDEIVLQDHAEPDTATMNRICRRIRDCGAEMILTTEKDCIKWLSLWPDDIPIAYPRLRTEFTEGGNEIERLIGSIVEKA